MQSSTTDFGHRVLGVYFREQDGIPLLDAAGEIALASTIAEQRDELWVSLLDYVPFLEPIATFVGMRAKELHRTKDAEVETAKLVAACARLAEAARAVRARDLARHQATLRACRAELVACTRGGDPDGTIRAAVLEKIVALGRGERRDEGLLALRMPRAGSHAPTCRISRSAPPWRPKRQTQPRGSTTPPCWRSSRRKSASSPRWSSR